MLILYYLYYWENFKIYLLISEFLDFSTIEINSLIPNVKKVWLFVRVSRVGLEIQI